VLSKPVFRAFDARASSVSRARRKGYFCAAYPTSSRCLWRWEEVRAKGATKPHTVALQDAPRIPCPTRGCGLIARKHDDRLHALAAPHAWRRLDFEHSRVSIARSWWRRAASWGPIPGTDVNTATGSISPRNRSSIGSRPVCTRSWIARARLSPMPGNCRRPSTPSFWTISLFSISPMVHPYRDTGAAAKSPSSNAPIARGAGSLLPCTGTRAHPDRHDTAPPRSPAPGVGPWW